MAAIDQAADHGPSGSIEVVAQAPTADLVNVMRPTFADAAQNYVPAPAAEVRYTAAIIADGRELTREVELTGVTRARPARLGGVDDAQAREALTAVAVQHARAAARAVRRRDRDAADVRLGGKEFEVLDWGFSIDAGVMLTLRETSAAIFDPGTGFATLDVAANTLLPKPSEVEQIGRYGPQRQFTTEVDRSILVRTTVSWIPPSRRGCAHGRIEVQYWRAGVTLPTGDWQSLGGARRRHQRHHHRLGQGVHYLFLECERARISVRGLWSVVKTRQNAVVPLVDAGLPAGRRRWFAPCRW